MTPETAEAVAREYLAIEAREQAMAQTVWGPELDAERHEDEVVRLWDELNASLDRWKILAEFPVQGVRIPELIPADGLSQGIRRWRGGPGTAVELDSEALLLRAPGREAKHAVSPWSCCRVAVFHCSLFHCSFVLVRVPGAGPGRRRRWRRGRRSSCA